MASLLESFYFLFEFDSKQVKEGKKATDDLNKSLSSTDKIGNKLSSSLQNLIKQYGGVVTAALSLGSILAGVASSTSYAIELGLVAKQLDVNIESLDAWGSAIQKNGGDAAAFQATLKKLGTDPALFGFAGGAAGALKQLPQLADAFSKLSHQGAIRLGEKMGLDEGTIQFLRQGRAEVEAQIKRQKELGVVTKQDADIAEKFNKQWNDTTHIFRSLFTTISSSILPTFTELLKSIEKMGEYFKKHSHLVVGAMIAVGTSILLFVVPPLFKAAAAALVLYAPFLAIGAIVVGLSALFALQYDDVMVFLNGGESVTGKLIKKWPIVGEVVMGVVKAVKWLGEAFKGLLPLLNEISESIIQTILGAILFVIESIEDLFGLYGKIKEFFGFGDKGVNLSVQQGQQALADVNKIPIGLQTSNTVMHSNLLNNKETTAQIGSITINTEATDANGIAAEIGKSMNEQLRQTLGNYSDGVVA